MKEYKVAQLIGMFEPKETTLKRFDELSKSQSDSEDGKNYFIKVENILNNTTRVNTKVEIDIDINVIHLSNEIKEEANYLLREMQEKNKEFTEALKTAIAFAEESKQVKSNEMEGKGWKRKLKLAMETLKSGGAFIKVINDGGESLHKLLHHLQELGKYFHLLT